MQDDSTCVRIPLRNRAGEIVAYALVDAEDEELAEYRWCLSRGYAIRSVPRNDGSGRWTSQSLHRRVLGLSPGDGLQADHINGDRLDNRRRNIRAGTQAANNENVASRGGSSRYRGVTRVKASGKWCAMVKHHGKARNLGSFDTEVEAADAASAWRLEHMPNTNENRRAEAEG